MTYTDQQLRQIVKNGLTREALSIGGLLKVNRKALYKEIDQVCVMCGSTFGKVMVPKDCKDTQKDSVCGGVVCRRKYEWGLKDDDQRSGMGVRAGVGELFIRDGALPTLADFTPSNKIKWDESSYISGPVGTGKTWALCAIACDALSFGRTSALVNCQWLQLHVRATYKPDSTETELDVLARYVKPDVLCLDDLGSGKTIDGRESEAARVLIYMLIDKRYARNKITHISSNWGYNNLAGLYDARIARRVKEMCQEIELKKVIK